MESPVKMYSCKNDGAMLKLMHQTFTGKDDGKRMFECPKCQDIYWGTV